jgi:hypothetical protein
MGGYVSKVDLPELAHFCEAAHRFVNVLSGMFAAFDFRTACLIQLQNTTRVIWELHISALAFYI